MRASLIFGLELVVLYAAASCVMGRLVSVSGFGGDGTGLGRMAFYLLIFPGVVLHESAHYLACLLTGTKVLHFAPFSPRRSVDGRLMLGYVRHERRGFPIWAIIGLAPILLNPLGLLLVTALLTPITFQEVSNPSFSVVKERIVVSGFLGDTPLLAAAWTYLSLSFALGSVPSREDLSSLPVMVLIFGGGVLVVGLVQVGPDGVLLATLNDLFTVAAGLYALPAAVAAVEAAREAGVGTYGRGATEPAGTWTISARASRRKCGQCSPRRSPTTFRREGGEEYMASGPYTRP